MLRRLGGSMPAPAKAVLQDVQAELQRRLGGDAAQSTSFATSAPGWSPDDQPKQQPVPEPGQALKPSAALPPGEGVVVQPRRIYNFVPPVNSWNISVSNVPRTALREDILHFLPPLGLDVEAIRPAFDSKLRVMDFWITFAHRREQQAALACDGRMLGQRRVRVTAVTREQMTQALQTRWVGFSRGRYLLVTGIEGKASLIDVMFTFNRFPLMPIAVNLFEKWGDQPVGEAGRGVQAAQQAAVVRLQTSEDAWAALRACNHGFVRSSRINVRVLP